MIRICLLMLLVVGLWQGSLTQAAPAVPIGAEVTNDATVVAQARHGLASITEYMGTRPDLFPRRTPEHQRALNAVQRQEVRDLWGRFLDYQLMLDAIWQRLGDDSTSKEGKRNAARDRIAYAAFLARYRYALDFIALADADPATRVVLDEPVAELGLPADSYADFKIRFLNVAIATEFAALSARDRLSGDNDAILKEARRNDEQRIWEAGKGDGIVNTLRNAGQIVETGGRRLVFPVQKDVSEWMGDTRVLYGGHYLIGPDQIAGLASKLQPGDVLLERREWFLSNVGLPGFWPHAALYVGTPTERATYFADPAVAAWLASQGISAGNFDELLKARYPVAYAAGLEHDAHGGDYRIMEAMSEGVVFTTLEHSAAADSVAVLRPRLSRLEVAKALLKAFEFQGRPYDFDFDFRTDATLVCTELVYKAYGPGKDKAGLRLPLRSVAGRPVLTANDIVRHFDETWDTPEQQFDLIAFLDGQAKLDRATNADLPAFRASWQRPKWHILVQDAPLATR